jgi:hypothetical protein
MALPGVILVRAEGTRTYTGSGPYQAVFRQTRLNFAVGSHLGSDLLLMIRGE